MNPIERYGLIALGVLALVGAVLLGIHRHERELVQQGRNETAAAVQAVTASAVLAQRLQEQHTADLQAENRREAQQQYELDLRNRRDADAAVQRLQLAADSRRTAVIQGAHTAATGAASGVPETGVVPRGLPPEFVDRVARLGEHARDLAVYAACLERAGTECVRDYQALSPDNAGQ